MKILPAVIFLNILINFATLAQESKSEGFSDCGLNQQAKDLAQLIIESDLQKRDKLLCNKELAKIALIKAKLMAKADDINHRVDYTTPNQLLRQNGINLPERYPLFDNQVEAIMGGVATAKESFKIFMTSPDHKSHLLGEYEFVNKQDQIGVGYYKDSDTTHVYYWVIYITRIIQTDEE